MMTHLFLTDLTNEVLARPPRWQYAYLPFGIGGHTGIGFKGEYQEAFASLQLLGNGYRGYNMTLMRFISTDSLSPFTTGLLNAYGYGPDPINYTDPTGHFSIQSWLHKIFKSDRIKTHSTSSPIEFLENSATWQSGTTTYISAHGNKYDVYLNNIAHAPGDIADYVRNKHPDSKNIVLLACHSADKTSSGTASFAQQLSDELNMPVTGFHGLLFSSGPHYYQEKIAKNTADIRGYQAWRSKAWFRRTVRLAHSTRFLPREI